jgi:hypothetical protein
MDENRIGAFLDRYGKALGSGDLATIADAWEVPALVLSDEGARAVSDLAEVRAFFAQARDWYRERGQVGTRPEIEKIEPISDRLVQARVRWLGLDEAGKQVAGERSVYLLRIGDDGQPRIHVALTVPERPPDGG